MPTNHARIAALFAAAAATTALPTPSRAQPYAFHTIALTGAQAPGLPAGVNYSFFSDPRLSLGGSVAFWAELAGPGVTTSNDGSVWSDRSGSLAVVAREGDPVSGTWVIGAVPSPAFSPDGRIALDISLVDTTQQGNPITLAIYAEDASLSRQLIAQEGQAGPPPIPPAGAWANVSLPALVGPAAAFNSNNGLAAWSGQPGQPTTAAAASGSPAPGTSGNFAFIDQPSGNAAGTLIFRATTSGAESMGLWASRGGTLSPVAVAGMQAPGAPAGAMFAEFALQPTIAADDTVAFWAKLSGVVSTADDTGIWTATAQGLAAVAREGDAAPGLPATFLGPIGQHPAAGGSGAAATVAFTSNLLGMGIDATNDSAVWVWRAGALALVAREGDHAPRLPTDVLFAGFSEPIANETGQVMFLARLRGPAVTPATSAVLYSTDASGRLVPLIRTGDFFDVGSGPARMVDEIIFDSDPASGHAQFIAGGVSIFKLVFRDTTAPPSMALSSGLFTAQFRCAPDLDSSGDLNVNDFIAYLSAFAAGNLRTADFTADGRLNVNDFVFYLNAFAAGCP